LELFLEEVGGGANPIGSAKGSFEAAYEDLGIMT
jgi:hypothetical protein